MPDKPIRRAPQLFAAGRSGLLSAGNAPWYADRSGRLLVGAYALLALVGVLVATGTISPWITRSPWRPEYFRTHWLAIPPQLPLYAFLGAMTHVFTTLAARPHCPRDTVARLAVRIPVATVLVVPVYVLFVPVVGLVQMPETDAAVRSLGGMAFLVGLFTKHAQAGIRGLVAKVVLGRFGGTLTRGGRS